ncbi:MAG: exopolysaccharide biosynthesis polyprenyl glycosylphosphotransferase, partial [Solirubrobacteraceae bacterium]
MDQSTGPGSRTDAVLRRTLAAADVLAAASALLIACYAVARSGIQPRLQALALPPLVVLVAKALGLYDRDRDIVRKTTIDEIPSILCLSVLYAMGVWLGESVLLRGRLDRGEFFVLILAMFVALVLARLLARTIAGAVTEPDRCIVVGNGGDASRVAGKLRGAHGVRTEVVGRVPLGETGTPTPVADAPAPEPLARVVSEQRIDRVIIAPDGHDQDEVLHAIRVTKALGVKVSVLPRLLEVVGSSSTFEDVDGMTLLGVREYGVPRSSQLLKRTVDLVGATSGLLFLSPVLVALAVAIKLDSNGPVLFRQPRIGRQGRRFAMAKFRSMVPDADAIKHRLRERNEVQGGLFKIADDPRITRVGRFLRRTSLDELPQLLNVLGGSMSLVGPRPLVEDEDALIEGWQRRRLAVKPGMTGMWQIFGSSRIPMHEMVKIDYLYGANW